MVEEARILRIVVASPGDVESERKVVPLVVDEVNRGVAGERGLVLKVTRWEKDASCSSGCFSRPQYVVVGLGSAAWKGSPGSHLLIDRGLVPGPKPQQGLERRDRLLALTMANDEFIKIDLEQMAAHGT
jgi:hypothetical protein